MADQPASTKFNVLVVDDDESIRYMMQTKLHQAGYYVSLAASGSHAIQILQTDKRFDLVLCDLKMSLKSGIDVIRFMKEKGFQIPTIIITGFPERDKIIAAAQLGIMDVMVKPVRHQDLMKLINAKLGVSDENSQSQAS